MNRHRLIFSLLIMVLSGSFFLSSCDKKPGKKETAITLEEGPRTPVLKKVGRPEEIERWLGTDPFTLGCYFEKVYDSVDPEFGCDHSGKTAPVSPKRGPEVSPELAEKIDPGIKQIFLFWEGGVLKSIQINFRDKEEETAIRKKFDNDYRPDQPYCSESFNCIIFSKKMD